MTGFGSIRGWGAAAIILALFGEYCRWLPHIRFTPGLREAARVSILAFHFEPSHLIRAIIYCRRARRHIAASPPAAAATEFYAPPSRHSLPPAALCAHFGPLPMFSMIVSACLSLGGFIDACRRCFREIVASTDIANARAAAFLDTPMSDTRMLLARAFFGFEQSRYYGADMGVRSAYRSMHFASASFFQCHYFFQMLFVIGLVYARELFVMILE